MKKSIRERGKIRLSRYFQNLKEGDVVSVKRDVSISANFPERIQGRTGVISGKIGRSYSIRIREKKGGKTYIIEPIHLKKINKVK